MKVLESENVIKRDCYFGKVFSDLVGVSPAVYREQNGLRTFERKL